MKGGMRGEGGTCVAKGGAWVAKGGVCGERGGMHGEGACMVKGGCVWWGGVHGERGGMRSMHPPRNSRSLRGRYASYWNAFLY